MTTCSASMLRDNWNVVNGVLHSTAGNFGNFTESSHIFRCTVHNALHLRAYGRVVSRPILQVEYGMQRGTVRCGGFSLSKKAASTSDDPSAKLPSGLATQTPARQCTYCIDLAMRSPHDHMTVQRTKITLKNCNAHGSLGLFDRRLPGQMSGGTEKKEVKYLKINSSSNFFTVGASFDICASPSCLPCAQSACMCLVACCWREKKEHKHTKEQSVNMRQTNQKHQ